MSTQAIRTATAEWRASAEALLSEAELIAPLTEGAFGELATDSEGEEVAARIQDRTDDVLADADRALAELDAAGDVLGSIALVTGTLAMSEALTLADQPDGFGELSVGNAQAVAFADARAALVEAEAVATLPDSLTDTLDKVQSAGATESWGVVKGSVGKLAGTALLEGLRGVLKGGAAEAFDTVIEHLKRWRDALKRSAARIAKWVVSKVKKMLPKSAQKQLDDLMKSLQEQVEKGASSFAGDLYGKALGRGSVEAAWRTASQDRVETATKKLPTITKEHIARIAWVTKGRKAVEQFDALLAALVGVGDAARLAFVALVVAVLAFVAWQVADAFDDVHALVS
ncbi:hypothetical protein GCM10009584_28970 [Ornithinimicrobium humiphilum]|nr:hypothetical protein [Ornithinimicrobium humiphilum]